MGETSSQELKFSEIQQMKMYCDNQVILHTLSNPVFHERTKHKTWLLFYSGKVVIQEYMYWVYWIHWSTYK